MIETSTAPADFFLPGAFTVATLPDAAVNARKYAWVSDLYGGPGDYCISNGANWRPVRPFAMQTISSSDANRTITPLVDAPTVLVTGTLTSLRTWTLSTTYAYQGATFRLKRTAGGLFNLLVGGVGLGLNSWADFEYDGSAWVQTASGGLL